MLLRLDFSALLNMVCDVLENDSFSNISFEFKVKNCVWDNSFAAGRLSHFCHKYFSKSKVLFGKIFGIFFIGIKASTLYSVHFSEISLIRRTDLHHVSEKSHTSKLRGLIYPVCCVESHKITIFSLITAQYA